MKKIICFSFSFLLLFSCKKETVEVEHDLQFQSNVIVTGGTYSLSINSVSSDITAVYKVKEDTDVHLLLVRDTSTTWLTGTIYVDGKAVKYEEGYKDTIDLFYTVK